MRQYFLPEGEGYDKSDGWNEVGYGGCKRY